MVELFIDLAGIQFAEEVTQLVQTKYRTLMPLLKTSNNTSNLENCGKDHGPNYAPLKDCSRCHVAKYCSVECQKKDWPKHKDICGKKTT